MNRRDFIVTFLQAFLLAFFPWLRTDRGFVLARQAAERFYPFWLNGSPYSSWAELYAAATAQPGVQHVEIDTRAEPAVVEPGVYNLDRLVLHAAQAGGAPSLRIATSPTGSACVTLDPKECG